MGMLLTKLLLPTLSSLALLPTVSVAAKRRFYMESMVYLFTMFFVAVSLGLWAGGGKQKDMGVAILSKDMAKGSCSCLCDEKEMKEGAQSSRAGSQSGPLLGPHFPIWARKGPVVLPHRMRRASQTPSSCLSRPLQVSFPHPLPLVRQNKAASAVPRNQGVALPAGLQGTPSLGPHCPQTWFSASPMSCCPLSLCQPIAPWVSVHDLLESVLPIFHQPVPAPGL